MLEYEIECFRTTIKHEIVLLQVEVEIMVVEEEVLEVVEVVVEGNVVVRRW